MVTKPEDYPWSSYRANGLGLPAKLWQPHYVYQRLGNSDKERAAAYRELFKGRLDSTVLDQIRQASNRGLALGSDRFKQEVAALAGRRVVALKRGPKGKREKNVEFLL